MNILRGPGTPLIEKELYVSSNSTYLLFLAQYGRNFSTIGEGEGRTTRGRSKMLDRRVWKEVIKLARGDKTCRKSNELIGNCFSEHGRVIR